MPAPLPLRLRALNAAATFAMKRGSMPSASSSFAKPHDERQKRRAMPIACKPGDPTIRTQDVRRSQPSATVGAATRVTAHPSTRSKRRNET